MFTRQARVKGLAQSSGLNYEKIIRAERLSVHGRMARSDIDVFGGFIVPSSMEGINVPIEGKDLRVFLGNGNTTYLPNNYLFPSKGQTIENSYIVSKISEMKDNGTEAYAHIGSHSNHTNPFWLDQNFKNSAFLVTNYEQDNGSEPDHNWYTDGGNNATYWRFFYHLVTELGFDGITLSFDFSYLNMANYITKRAVTNSSDTGKYDQENLFTLVEYVDLVNTFKLFLKGMRLMLYTAQAHNNDGRDLKLNILCNAGDLDYTNAHESAGFTPSTIRSVTADDTQNPYSGNNNGGFVRSLLDDAGPYGGLANYKYYPEVLSLIDTVYVTSRRVSEIYKEDSTQSDTYNFDIMEAVRDAFECVADRTKVVVELTTGAWRINELSVDYTFSDHNLAAGSVELGWPQYKNDQYGNNVSISRSYVGDWERVRQVMREERRYVNCGFCVNDLFRPALVARGDSGSIDKEVNPERYCTPNKVYEFIIDEIRPKDTKFNFSAFQWASNNGLRSTTLSSNFVQYYAFYDGMIKCNYSGTNTYSQTFTSKNS